jgi:sigma-B regulation protein RsbU (phosphoserine phosphatase)
MPAKKRVSQNGLTAGVIDLSQAVRGADSVDGLYRSLIEAICETFSLGAASLFVRDDQRGDFPCRVSTAFPAGPEDGSSSGVPPLVPNAFVIRRLRNLSSPLQIEKSELESWEQALRDAPPAVLESRMREKDTLQRTHSSMLVPLKTRNDLVGLLSLGPRTSGAYNPEERHALQSVAGQLALVIENTRLAERLVEHERLRAEVELAAEVQRSLLPGSAPELPGVELCGYCQPARQVGGDYYDFIPVDDGAIVCVADVAGKGISAALLMSVVQASLRGQLLQGRRHESLAEVVTRLNRQICASISPGRFVTCFCLELNYRDGTLHFVNAGHSPPLLVSKDNTVMSFRKLDIGGPVLGLFSDAIFSEGTVQLASGDVLVAYTDGVSEAMNTQEEEFSDERLCDVLKELQGASGKEILKEILSRVSDWSKGAPQHDDLTAVVMKRTA